MRFDQLYGSSENGERKCGICRERPRTHRVHIQLFEGAYQQPGQRSVSRSQAMCEECAVSVFQSGVTTLDAAKR